MKRYLCILLTLVTVLAVLTGCAAGSKYSNMAMDTVAEEPAEDNAYDVVADEMAEYDTAAGSGFSLTENTVEPVQDRKIIYTADYTIATRNFEEDYGKILEAMDSAGGYLSQENTYGTEPKEYGDDGRYADITLRIPLEQYSAFLETLAGIGTVQSKNQYTEDVTTDYYDNESRIEFYEAHYEKLMEYLEKATSMEDILSIEAQITETLYTLDSLKGTRNYYDRMTQYTTVDIHLNEVVAGDRVVTSETSLGERISDGFHNVLNGLGVFFEGFLVFLISASPVLLILAAIFCAIFFPIHLHKKKKKAKRAALKAAEQPKAENEKNDKEEK